ncbi:MAG: hypothetical protein ACE5KE_02445 [Methanosarcinales archaeon]
MLFFKKKKEEKMPPLGKGVIPTDRVKELSSKGFTEPEIIGTLRKEGFSAEEIDKGLTQALKTGVTETKAEMPKFPPRAEPPTTELPTFPPATEKKSALPTLEEAPKPKAEMPAVPETTLPEEYYYPETYPTEEYVDYLVKEKMRDVEQKVSEFSIRYGELEKKIEQIYDQLNLLTKAKPSEQQLLSVKLDSFKETVDDISIRLSSLEKAFKETLPALIESVRALSDLVQRFKKEA